MSVYFINTDASIEPFNPGGIVSWAFIVKQGKTLVHKDAGISIKGGPEATNNVGEYHAVVAAMLWLIQLPHPRRFPAIIKSDSQLIVNQCCEIWECRDLKLIPLREMVLKAKKKYEKNITFQWIPREKNSEADELSRTAYDPEDITYFKEHQIDIMFDWDDIKF